MCYMLKFKGVLYMSMGWYSYNPKDTVRIYEDEYVTVDYNKTGKMYRVTIFEDGHFSDDFWFDEYKEDR